MNYAELLIQNQITKEEPEDINQCGIRKSEVEQIGEFDFTTRHREISSVKRSFFKKRVKD